MAFQFTADDIGFEVNPIKVDSTGNTAFWCLE